MEIQDITKKLEKLQLKAEEIKQQKSKLEGEAQALNNRLVELEERSIQETGVKIAELPRLITGYETKISDYMKEIENILGETNG